MENRTTDTYQSITGASEAILREKASKFIAFAYPVKNEEEVKECLSQLRKQYFDANHHCYAYRLGIDQDLYRFSDDGEPAGSAGRPIYGQIQSLELYRVLVVVVRYFGGTKLGVSGLIQAYKTVAREALESARVETYQVSEVFRLHYPYEKMNEVMKMLKDNKLDILSTRFDLTCELDFRVRKNESDRIQEELGKKNGIEIKYLKTE